MKNRRTMKTKCPTFKLTRRTGKPPLWNSDGLVPSHPRKKSKRRRRHAIQAQVETPVDQSLVYSTTTASPRLMNSPARGVRTYSSFDQEKSAYEARKRRLLADQESAGKFVVLVANEMIGPFPTLSAALRAGYGKFGVRPLYVRQVTAEEPVADSGATLESCQS